MRIFLDANVLFTAALSPDGNSSAILRLARVVGAELVTSPVAAAEARRNVVLKRPEAHSRLQTVFAGVTIVAEARPNLVAWAEQHVASKDAPILAAAVNCRATILITGDRRHFGALFDHQIGTTRVLTPVAALELLITDVEEAETHGERR